MLFMAKKVQTDNTNLKVLNGRVNTIHYYNHENGWASFRIDIKENKEIPNIGKSINCSGTVPDIQRGDVLTFQGYIEETKKYGKQFKVVRFTDESIVNSESTPEQIQAYLCSGCIKGIGPARGEKIFAMFGVEAFDVIENNFMRLTEVDGIGKATAEKIHNNYSVDSSVRSIVSALLPFGMSPTLAFKLYKKWGINAVEVVKMNPYLMADPEEGVEGIGFKTADSIAMKMGIDIHSPLRLQSLIVYLLMHGSMDGNIFYTYEELLKVGDEYFTGISPKEIRENLDILHEANKVIIEENRIYAISYYLMEQYNAQKLVSLHQAVLKDCVLNFEKIEEKLGNIKYDEGQKLAIETASLDTTGVMVLTGGPGVGKAQPLYSKVLTPDGFINMGDIKVGDKVISGTGNISTVLGVYPQGERDVYELTFNDGSTCRCSDEHLWTVQTRKDRLSYSHGKFRGQRERTIELKEMLKDYKMSHGRLKYSVKYVKPIEFMKKEFYIHPYLLGLLLGDGHLNDEGVEISLYEEQLREDIYKFFPDDKYELSLKSRNAPNVHDYTIRYNGNDIYNIPQHPNMKPLNYHLYKLGLKGKRSYEKFIPKDYLYASEEQRRWLLKGLLDTDAYVNKDSNSIEYSTSSEQLKNDIIELVRSLGGYAKATKRRGIYKKNGEHVECRDNYRVTIQFTIDNKDCLYLERKRNMYNPKRTSDNVKRYIKDIKYIGKEECQCIYIDDPSHLYITDNYIITHNTTVTKGIIEMLKESGYKILCAAPTGRASKRMHEATGHLAFTIHRLLGCKGPNQFEKNQDNPLDCDALLIDEASMIDNALLYRLLSAVRNGTKVIFIGDTDQLPPIGAGNFLRDAIASDFFPVVHLKHIHRQGEGSLIISNAHAINEGRNIKIRNTEDSDCVFMNMDEIPVKGEKPNMDEQELANLKNGAVLDEIVDLVTKKIPRKYGYDPKDVQVLVPMKKSPVGVNNINLRLQAALNESPVKIATKSGVFYVGDKVMQIRNNFKKGVFNGDIGIVESISKENQEMIVRFPNSDPTMFNNYIEVCYDFRELDELVLAYACTIHKSQGSEYPAIVMVVSYQHYIMLQRNLVYTGITRAKKLCYIVGTEKAIYHASNNVPVQRRNTTLVTRIYDYIKELVQEEEETEKINKQEEDLEGYDNDYIFSFLEA